MPCGQIAVLIPSLVVDLDEADAAFGQPPREQAVRRERARLAAVLAVHLEDRLRLVRQVGHFRHARLHAVGHFVLRDPRLDLRVEFALELVTIQLVEFVEHRVPTGCTDAVGIAEIQDRVLAGTKLHALILRVQEAAPPEPRVERLILLPGRHQHDERGQVVVHRAQPVGKPRPHRRPAGDLRARLEERDRRVVVDRLGEHRLHEAHIINDVAVAGQQIAEPRARLPMLGEFEDRPGQRQRRLLGRHAGEPLTGADEVGQLLAVLFVQQRLVVEQILLRRPAGLKQIDHSLDARREMQLPEHAAAGRGRGAGRAGQRTVEQRAQRQTTQPRSRGTKEMAARDARQLVKKFRFVHDHSFPIVFAIVRRSSRPD